MIPNFNRRRFLSTASAAAGFGFLTAFSESRVQTPILQSGRIGIIGLDTSHSMEAADQSKQKGGAAIALSNVLEKAGKKK